MKKQELGTFHALYAAVHHAHKDAPEIWTDAECNRILTAIMAAKSFSWRVIGITPAALKKFADFGFRYKSGEGITRGHIYSRIETVRMLLVPKEPVSPNQFIDTWLQRDSTILCAKGENKTSIPKYIPIENDDGSLFSCERKLAGWHHKKKEQDILKRLFHSKSRHRLVQHREQTAKRATHKVRSERGTFEPVTTNWGPEEVARRRALHHKVKVEGKVYPSLYRAFVALRLPVSQHEAFRKALKLKKRLPFKVGTKTYQFEISEPNRQASCHDGTNEWEMASGHRNTVELHNDGKRLVLDKLRSLGFEAQIAKRNGRAFGITADKRGKHSLLRVTTTRTARAVWTRKKDGSTFPELRTERDFVVIVDLANGPRFFVVPTSVVQKAIDIARTEWISGTKRDGGKRVDAPAQRLDVDDNVDGPAWRGYGTRWQRYVDNWDQLVE